MIEEEITVTDNTANVFQDWKVDTEETYKTMLLEDFKYWKLNRFIKDPEDIKACEQIIRNNIVELKDLYTSLISCSNFPNIDWMDFSQFVKQANIIDKATTFAVIDRLFIATNVELE